MKPARLNAMVTALLCSSALAAPAFAQTADSAAVADGTGEDMILITGVRASQMRSVEIKRDASAIVDAISAEDIGKLPDVTIVDSLQRISGVQILRNAGEGTTVNIRGLPQVVTLLNGEQYLSPANLGTAQPNLNDVPAQLVSGVTVYKSQDVRNAQSGISGTLDLRTRRPFDFKNGLTVSGQAEYQHGERTKENDYLVSGLVNWRSDNLGIMLGGVQSKSTLGNNYAGWGGGIFGNNDWGGYGGGPTPNWIAPHGYETFHREVERNRLGLNGAIQVDLGGGFKLTGEAFYTRLVEHDLKAGMNISNRWTGLGWTTPTVFEATSVNSWSGPWQAVKEYDLDAWWVNSFSVNRTIHSNSKNFNLQLEYDDGGAFSASFRAIYADADFKNTNGQVQGDLSNWKTYPDRTFTLFRDPADPTRGPFYPASIAAQYSGQFSNGIVGSAGGRYINPNPLGYAGDPQLHLDISNNDMRWSGFNTVLPTAGGLGAGKTLADYMANLNSYTVGAYSSEGNNSNASNLKAVRADASYDFEKASGAFAGFINRLDVGARLSERKTNIEVYHLFSNLYAGQNATNAQGCAVQWKAIDVVLNNSTPGACRAGENVPNPAYDPGQPVSASNPQTVFQGYTAWRPTLLATNNNTYFLSDFGSQTQGFPGVWVADPRDFNDPLAFQTKVFGNAFPVIIPGSSYDVNFREFDSYANLALEAGPISGVVGLRAVHTKLKVRQNLTGATIPYGDTNSDVGDFYSGNSYWDFLPTVNMQLRIGDRMKLRASFAKTMIPLDLGSYGGGLTIATSDSPCPTVTVPANTNGPCGGRQVTSANAGGNPQLAPWRSNNYDLSLEYYLGRASLLSAAFFRLDIDSFVESKTLTDGRFADSDGVIRRTVPFTRPVQGRGGKLQGYELSAKLAFSDLFESSLLRNFGVDANYTYSNSKQTQSAPQLDGELFPFPDNSKSQYNLVGWYQDEKFQARVAYNRRAPRVSGQTNGIAIFQETTQYVDVNVTYNVTPQISIYANGSNVFGEIERYYYKFDSTHRQFSSSNEFEPRYSVGVRAKF